MAQQDYLVRKSEKYEGLITYPTFITDSSFDSPNYFILTGIPSELTAGRNAIKITANLNTMRIGTEIAVECLDQNNNSIYTEINNYLDSAKRRIVTIYVYPETPSGIARITFIGIAKNYVTPQGNLVPVPTEWKDKYNVKWSKLLYVDASKRNSTEIIFDTYPMIMVRETYKRSIQTSLIPGDSRYAQVELPGALYHNTSAAPLTIPTSTPSAGGGTIDPGVEYPTPITPIVTPGGYTPGTQIVYPSEKVSVDIINNLPGGSGTISDPYTRPSLPSDNNIIYADTGTTTYSNTVSSDSIKSGYRVVESGEGVYAPGGQVLAKKLSPILKLEETFPGNFFFTKEMEGGTINIPNPVSPVPTLKTGQSWVSNDDQTYTGVIKEVLSKSTVAMQNPYQRLISYDGIDYNLQFSRFELSNTFVSWSEAPTFSQSEAYDSHAYIEIGALKPITGNVYKIKVYTKSHSNPHEFNYIGEHILESTNMFIDTGSITTTDGIGIFNNTESLAFWTASSVNTAPPATLLTSSEHVIEAMHISSSENPTIGAWVDVTTDEYELRFFGDIGYQLTFSVFGESRSTQPGELELYISGSTVLGGGELFIGEIKIPSGGQRSYTNLTFPFKTNLLGNGKPIFRVKHGNWHIGNIKIQPVHTVGFAPEHSVFSIPVDPRWDSDILDFKFEFYNYKGEMCETSLIYTNANFEHGPSFYLQGSDNLVTGSIFFGNVLYEGIEMAGLNSAYMRNIGYDGFNAANDGTGGYGFMAWSGSIFPGGSDNYAGVGFELVGAGGSLRFRTEPSIFEVIADTFFIGNTGSQFISGSDGNIEISSSDFWLQRDGTLIIGSDATINGSLTVSELLVPTSGPPYLAAIHSDGTAEFQSVDVRGTLSTTVFEKETVNAVGGQLIVSNATTIFGGSADYELYASDTNLPIKNPGGFKRGEYLIAKATSSTGFVSEMMQIVTAGTEFTSSELVNTVTNFGGGSIPWINTSNLTADDSNYARAVNGTYLVDLDMLQFTNFGFSIPTNAQVLGVEAEIVYYVSGPGPNLSDQIVQLVGVGFTSDNKGTGALVFNQTTPATQSWGGLDDTWGGTILPSDVNSSDFGFNFRVRTSPDTDNDDIYIDYVKLNVSYEVPNGVIVVTRNVDGLGAIPTMSESQVIVSQGKENTGYILLNAYPNDISTPYIDIVERTGSGVDDIETKVRLGDLSGLAGIGPVSDNPGFGLYSENVFLSGTITASAGRFGDDTEYISFDGTNLEVNTPNFNIDGAGQVTATNLYLSDSVFADSVVYRNVKINSLALWNQYCVESVYANDYVLDVSGLNSSIDPSAEGAIFIRFEYWPPGATIRWMKTFSEPQTAAHGGFVMLEDATGFSSVTLKDAIGNDPMGDSSIDGEFIRFNVDFDDWSRGSWNAGEYTLVHGERVKLIKSSQDWKIHSSNKWQNINVIGTASFGSDHDTGIFRADMNKLAVAANDATSTTFDNYGIGLIDGTVYHPSIHFENKANYGLYYQSAGAYSDGIAVSLGSSGVPKFFFESDGTFHCWDVISDNLGATSDVRLKKNVTLLSGSLDKIMSVEGVNFEWIDSDRPGLNAGVIAQQLETIIPEAVSDIHTPVKDIESYKVVNYNQLIPYLIESIKELKHQLDELKGSINEGS